MPLYVDEVKTTKQYKGNAVIRIGGVYFAAHRPDSGLFIGAPFCNILDSLVLNQTSINPKNVTTTIASTSFKLLDKNGLVSRLILDRAQDFIGVDVDIWLGRVDVGMDFSEYYQLPTTRISKVSKPSGERSFTIATRDATDRMNRPLYDTVVRLNGDILAGTTTILAKDDISDFPASGAFHVDSEIISYTSKNNTTKTFSGCSRGAFSTTPAAHSDNTDMERTEIVTGINPLTLLLQLLISGGGGGAYDVFSDGLGISQSLIDVTAIEAIREEKFVGDTFSLAIYNLENALQYIEKQILLPCNLRFSFSSTSKLTVALLDSPIFVEEVDVIDHDTLTQVPESAISDADIINKIVIDWNYNEATKQYAERSVYQDATSIATYGLCKSPLSFEFKGPQSQTFIDDFANRMLERLALPTPQISVKTQLDKSLLNLGEKTQLVTTTLPNEYGDMNFASDLEIVSRAINWETGDVSFKLAYTSFTNQRLGYIAPSDQIVNVGSQSAFDVNAGRGAYWAAGWKVRLFDTVANGYTADAVNEIASIVGDTITFTNAWTTPLTTDLRLSFADYDDATASQKRYAFVSINGQDFSRNEKQYTIAP